MRYITSKMVILSSFLLLWGLTACELDYSNNSKVTPDDVWRDAKMVHAFLNDIHGSSMPGWSWNGEQSDEGMVRRREMDDFLRGIISVEKTSYAMGPAYKEIEKVNYFLERLELDVPEMLFTAQERGELEAQARFWRAWNYWELVKNLGGVPLILKSQDSNDVESLYRERNSTSECIEQILADLDYAIGALPELWDDNNYGRIDQVTAWAFKGRVQLWYASPLFNPENDPERWEAAYRTNKQALEVLRKSGKGLYPDFTNLWTDEQNEEVILVNQYYYPGHTYNQTPIRPELISNGAADYNQPYFPLLMAFPQRDGSSLELDRERLVNDEAYNQRFMTDFYTNRDDRFHASIFCGGRTYPSADLAKEVRFWIAWLYEDANYLNLASGQFSGREISASTGFYQMKGLDPTLDKSTLLRASTDWVEIRFAEVLMNFGECANELGLSGEALQVLYDIRQRAGILQGEGRFGIEAHSQEEIREAYITERFVEFAFENKRRGDLRRWKRYDILNSHIHRSSLHLVLKDSQEKEEFDYTSDISNPAVREKFRMEFVYNLDQDAAYKFEVDLAHWFYALSVEDLNSNAKLQQNKEWGGSFDPLR